MTTQRNSEVGDYVTSGLYDGKMIFRVIDRKDGLSSVVIVWIDGSFRQSREWKVGLTTHFFDSMLIEPSNQMLVLAVAASEESSLDGS